MPQRMFSHDNFYTNAFNKLNEVIDIVNSLSASNFTASVGYPVNVQIVDTFIPYINGNKYSGLSFTAETYYNGITSNVSTIVTELTGSLTGAYSLTFTPSATGFWFVNMISASAISQAYYYVSSLTGYSISGGSGSGEANTASNLLADADKVKGLFSAKSGVDLQFKSLSAGNNISLSSDGSSIIVHANTSSVNTSTYATTTQLQSHTADSTIHYAQSSINLGNLSNVDQSATADNYILVYKIGTNTWVAQPQNNTISGQIGQISVFDSVSSVTGYSSLVYGNDSITSGKVFSTITAHTENNELTTKIYVDTLTSETISIYMDTLRLMWINM